MGPRELSVFCRNQGEVMMSIEMEIIPSVATLVVSVGGGNVTGYHNNFPRPSRNLHYV